MRFPWRPPRCGQEMTERRAYPYFSTTHTCGLRAGHRGNHLCRKRTCRRGWA